MSIFRRNKPEQDSLPKYAAQIYLQGMNAAISEELIVIKRRELLLSQARMDSVVDFKWVNRIPVLFDRTERGWAIMVPDPDRDWTQVTGKSGSIRGKWRNLMLSMLGYLDLKNEFPIILEKWITK